MFDKDLSLFPAPVVQRIFIRTGQVIYMIIAGLVNLAFLSFYSDPPGTPNQLRDNDFRLAKMFLVFSVILSVPVAIIVVRKLAKHERPISWHIVLAVTAFPLLFSIAAPLVRFLLGES
jgi:hypothetical protein